MSYKINRAMVIGAGIMGSGIAAHLANAGIPVFLVDVVPSRLTPEEETRGLTLENPGVRNRIVNQGLASLKKARPPALFSSSKLELITTGNMEDDFSWAREADWIIEAVVEDLDVKRRVMARVDEIRRPSSLVSTNTSGIPVHLISEGRSPGFKACFMGTHFFNPARYMRLLELVPTPQTDPEALDFLKLFGERRLGKKVVLCKDTPNFVANRLAVIMGRATLNDVLENHFTVEEVDAVTGPLLGRPKTATFRLFDLVGTDISRHVSDHLYAAIPHDLFREELRGPAKVLTEKMVDKGLLGNKVGQGFYKRVKGKDGKETYQVLDLETLDYRQREETRIPLIEAALRIRPLGDRFRFLLKKKDRFGRFLWHETAFALSYASHLVPEIAESFYAIDDAMKAGFSHEMGPFEIWDALGVRKTADRMEADGFAVSAWVREMLGQGARSFYKETKKGKRFWDQKTRTYLPLPSDPRLLILSDRKRRRGVVTANPSASLIDLGEGVLGLEFHAKANALSQDVLSLAAQALDRLEEEFCGLVIGNQGRNFSAGADVVALLVAAENGQWEIIEGALKEMQNLMQRFRYSSKPVVAAPFGMTLGGGAELAMAADRICASAETYMGLVEVGVGLVPSGGGCAEMIRRILSPSMKVANTDPMPFLQKAFENIALAKVSESAYHAKELGFLAETDRVVMNADHLLHEAVRMVLEMHAAGYVPPAPGKPVFALGTRGMAFLMQAAQTMAWGGYITPYENTIARKLAHVLSGGPLSAPQWVTEQYMLDLEREAFLSLMGEGKTIERIKHMLTTGKPLRN